MSARVWSMAGVASVLLHGAGLGAIALSTEPEEVPDQPVPKSRFSIEAAEVPRSRAAPEAPATEAAPQAEAQTTTAQSGSVPLSRAEPTPMSASKVAAATNVGTTLPQSAATGTSTPVVQGSGATLTASAAQVAPVVAERVQGSTITTTAPQASPITASATPTTQPLSAVVAQPQNLSASLTPTPSAAPALKAAAQRPAPETPQALAAAPATANASAAPQATPVAAPAPAAVPQAPQSADLPLPALAGKATLGWSGADDAPVSATSLAAIAAFTQAGDLQAASAEIRDGIEGILAAVPCARLQTTFLPDTGALELRGHIPEDGLRAPVLAALQEQVGSAIALSDQLLILPRPQCGALSGIAAVGLPQSTEQLSDPAVIGEDGFARTYTYVDGERLRLDLTAPDYDSYIYMDYFVADGTVIHLQPNDIVPLEFAPAKSSQSVGRAREGKPFLELTVSAPFGQEIAAAFATSVPLYEGTRPIQEPAEAYLAFLKERVAAARAANPDFKGEWVYFFITTEAG